MLDQLARVVFLPWRMKLTELNASEKRNQIILEEIKNLMDENRKVLILSDRKEHLKYLMEQI